jgi:hypothetical protein
MLGFRLPELIIVIAVAFIAYLIVRFVRGYRRS